jgi:NADP-dependent 3-hydroxy acid dehydrogenase YdfG
LPGKAIAVQMDVTQREQVKDLVDAAVNEYGRIDVMINNAGLTPQSLLESLRVEDWDRMIDVNIKSVLYGIAAALPCMKEQKARHIINVSSVAGHKVGPGGAVYSATKSLSRQAESVAAEVDFRSDQGAATSHSELWRALLKHSRNAGRGEKRPVTTT